MRFLGPVLGFLVGEAAMVIYLAARIKAGRAITSDARCRINPPAGESVKKQLLVDGLVASE
jgi:hypothetical protein